jgi:hypothetical protein
VENPRKDANATRKRVNSLWISSPEETQLPDRQRLSKYLGGRSAGCPTRRFYVWGFWQFPRVSFRNQEPQETFRLSPSFQKCEACSYDFRGAKRQHVRGPGAPHVDFTCGAFDLLRAFRSTSASCRFQIWGQTGSFLTLFFGGRGRHSGMNLNTAKHFLFPSPYNCAGGHGKCHRHFAVIRLANA